jgi:hypothetical protein
VTFPSKTAVTHPHSIDRAIELIDHESRNLDAGGSGGRERGTPRAADEQLQTKLVLQITNLPRQRGLGDAKTFRCCAECRFVGNADDVPELSKVHDDVPATRAEAANVCRVCAAR